MNGGTLVIDSPRPYCAVADGVLRGDRYRRAGAGEVITTQDPDFYDVLERHRTGLFFDRETFGADLLAAGYRNKPWREFLAGAPLSAAAKRDMERVETGTRTTCPA